MKTIRHGFMILCTAALFPALPAAAADPSSPAPQVTVPGASEPEATHRSWDPLPFSLSTEMRATWIVQDDARRLWGKRSPSGGALSFAYDGFRVARKTTVGLDLAWVSITASTTNDVQLPQKMNTQVFDLGVSLRYEVFPWLSPYARVAGGVGWATLSMGSSGFDLRDRVALFEGSAGAGLLARSPGVRIALARRSFRLALVGRVEGGYITGNATNFSLKLHTSGVNTDPIPVAPVSVGEVARRFPYLRVSLGVAF